MAQDQNIRLIEIGRDCEPVEDIELPEIADDVLLQFHQVYDKLGFERPWTGYITVRDGQAVGTCAFKGPPQGGIVEIAYFTFPDFENQGLGRAAAAALIAVAEKADPSVVVTARTLPEKGPSASILQRLGFRMTGEVADPDDGQVWEWRLDKKP